jgi:cyclopropane fatty-acyl-phospholipid synthase-like methyltransferase
MVWAGKSSSGVTQLSFFELGAKKNSDYYIKKILKPFLRKNVKILYPNGDYIVHQDSAPSHSSKKAVKYLQDNKVTYITPEQWMPNSPDAAPCDYFLWRYLKNRLKHHEVKSINRLKNALQAEFKKISQEMINRALKSWPK